MKRLLILLLFPLMMFSQDSTLIGDVDCSGEVNSQDASLILQFVTNVIDELPCQDNMTGLTPEQLQEIINMMDEQLSINYSGGGSSNYPIMISSISTETMYIGDAFVYCNDLEEGGNTDWFLPNLDQLTYAISGGCELPDDRLINTYIWTTSKNVIGSSDLIVISESGSYGISGSNGSGVYQCRCVRLGEGETSEGSSGSSNSSGSSVGGNSEQPITMIGPMYIGDDFPEFFQFWEGIYGDQPDVNIGQISYFEALHFCSQLEYNEYDDWFLPSYVQMEDYIEQQGVGITFLNTNDFGTLSFWLRKGELQMSNSILSGEVLRINGDNSNYVTNVVVGLSVEEIDQGSSFQRCFCVR